MAVLELLASLSRYIPAIEKPARRPSLPARLAWTAIVVLLYLIMSEIPLYGVAPQETQGQQTAALAQLLLGMNIGSLMTLGIGPIVTAGIILEVLVGGKIIDLDLTKPGNRKVFMGAQKSLAIIFAVIEGAAYAIGCRFWVTALGAGGCPVGTEVRVLVVVQLLIATIIILWFDDMVRKGWGIGSALSLFIAVNVVKDMAWRFAGPILAREGEYYGWLAQVILNKDFALIRYELPDLLGLVATLAIITTLIYFQLMKVYIPVTSPRYGSLKTRIPLNFIYVTNIPILFVGIAVTNIAVFQQVVAVALGQDSTIVQGLGKLYYYVSPPRGILQAFADPLKLVTFIISWLLLGLLFGFIWVEVAGLSAQKQAENLVKSGLELPGIRKNPKILERLLKRYIYPLTIISSLLVTGIAILADIFGAYGSGSGLVLLVGIVYNFYQQLAYERTLEMYPTLQRIIGA